MLIPKKNRVTAASNYRDPDTVYVVFRKCYDSESKTWLPTAFWYSTGQSMTFGRIYFIEADYSGYDGEPRFYSDEADMSWYNGSKRLLPTDEGYEDLREYVYDWLSFDGKEGFKKIVERQRVDNDMLSQIWNRRI